MRRYRQEVAAFAAVVLVAGFVGRASVAAAADPTVTASACSVAAGHDASHITQTCNFGLTPEQLREATRAAVEEAKATAEGQTKAAVAGVTEALQGTIDRIRKQLGVTEEAAKTLLRIVGEQTDVPDERLGEVLTKVALDYKRLQAQVAALNPDNPTARGFVERAKTEIAAGRFEAAHQLLAQARQAQIVAAQEARKLREQAQVAEDAQLLGAAASTATEGDLAMTELHYAQAADLFGQAAELVPPGHVDEATGYRERQADALYREGDEHGTNAALSAAIETWKLVLQQRPRERVPLDWAMTQ
ncbi:hypothetical protein, partial [Sphingomonas sp.]|uniref:hypothetical protein n=1 Tax=Sphingomonas sp. TaxID=28214 RepID=UPI0025EF5BDD